MKPGFQPSNQRWKFVYKLEKFCLEVTLGLILAVSGFPAYSQEILENSSQFSSQFSDIQGHWAESCIQELEKQNVIDGDMEIPRFRPNDPINRVELAILLNSAFQKIDPVRDSIRFVDIPSNYWAYDAVQSAYQKGFLSPYITSVFNPTLKVSRLQALTAIAQGLKIKPQNLKEAQLASIFEDFDAIPAEFRTAVLAATESQLVVNYPNIHRLNPNQLATRAEVAAFICQARFSPQSMTLISDQYIARIPVSNSPPISPKPNSAIAPIPEEFRTEEPRTETSNPNVITAPEATSSVTQMMATEDIEAQLSYHSLNQFRYQKAVELQIIRRGTTRFEAIIALIPRRTDQQTDRVLELKIQDLNNDQEMEIIVDFETVDDQNQTLYYSMIYRYDSVEKTYVPTQQFW
ncbi:MAG: S-layer homology domain-containing protein [Oscillatoriales cyanobacterium RM2_1_1]|nr:S-layer homology domain-containing protein [Oscillatoriales cyanobacterium SM2_3_0]NJO47648.1 S-layer homology domain-containing protein [Oscillatoriales cyanobacterium RM2_1_1]